MQQGTQQWWAISSSNKWACRLLNMHSCGLVYQVSHWNSQCGSHVGVHCLVSEQVHGQKEAALARVKAVEKQKQDMVARNEEMRWVLLLQPFILRCCHQGTRVCCS